jgi:hypothetical protein
MSQAGRDPSSDEPERDTPAAGPPPPGSEAAEPPGDAGDVPTPHGTTGGSIGEGGRAPPKVPTTARGARPPTPSGPRRFLVELLTITAGVLVALSLEGLREWAQDRRLVAEARASIHREISDNLAEVESVIGAEAERRTKLQMALRLANELLETETTGVSQVDLGLAIAEVSAAAWETAERTGALGHMAYEVARRYARVYEVQALFTEHQARTMERLSAAAAGIAQDPMGALPSDLETFRQHVLYLLGDLAMEQEIANMLVESYREVLATPAGMGS